MHLDGYLVISSAHRQSISDGQDQPRSCSANITIISIRRGRDWIGSHSNMAKEIRGPRKNLLAHEHGEVLLDGVVAFHRRGAESGM